MGCLVTWLALGVRLAHARPNGGGSSLAWYDGVQVELGGRSAKRDRGWGNSSARFVRGFGLPHTFGGDFGQF